MKKILKIVIILALVGAVAPFAFIFGLQTYTQAKNQYIAGEPVNQIVDKRYLLNKKGNKVVWRDYQDWGVIDIEVINSANPETFEVLARDIAKDDKKVFYLKDVIVGADAKSFEVLEGARFFKDSNQVYCKNHDGPKTLENTNPASFEVVLLELNNWNTATDGQGIYNGCNEVSGIDLSTLTQRPNGSWTDGRFIYSRGLYNYIKRAKGEQ